MGQKGIREGLLKVKARKVIDVSGVYKLYVID